MNPKETLQVSIYNLFSDSSSRNGTLFTYINFDKQS